MRTRTKSSSVLIREYVSTEAKPPARLNQQTIQTVETIVHLVDDAVETSKQLSDLIRRSQTLSHLRTGGAVPKPVLVRIETVNNLLQNAKICFRQGLEKQIGNAVLSVDFAELADMIKAVQGAIDCAAWFGHSNATFADQLPDKIEWIATKAQKLRNAISVYSSRTSIPDPVPEKKIVETPKGTQVLFDDSPTNMNVFLDQARQRGWKIAERDAQDVSTEDGDDFEEAYRLLQRLLKPTSALLPSDAVVGVSKFPIITFTSTKPPDRLIRTFLNHPYNYDVYLLYNQYMVIDNMLLLGIHRSIVKVLDENNDIIVDTEKFDELLPFVANNNPKLSHIATETIPVKPARRVGEHYYCPLYPVSTFGLWRGLKDWAPHVK